MRHPRLPSQAEIIRAWLELQDGPRTCPQIATAIGRQGDTLVYQNVHRMFRDGILAREGRCRFYAFRLAREARVQVRMPRDEQLRRNAEAERKRRARQRDANGGRTREQWCAEMAAQHQAWLARKEAEKAARQAQREAERATRKAAKPKPRPSPAPRPKAAPKPGRQRRARLQTGPTPIPRLDHAESVQDYLRRGGQIVRLEPFAVSRPLRINQQRKAA